ncbi:4'-phosphopantetheinyl transferase [Phenylobacterium sp.]|jgi:4'-phosphopantetheinyl transferase EntD|uniref:4'-phosphopantetheinyl transferase n=1 Tax=Phenylobacterium sp. TaxID=1871053 RepID=UPI0037C8441A
MIDGEIAALFTAPVAAVVASPAMYDAPLRTGERAIVAGAAPRRIREFTAGRAAAHLALARLGAEAQDILRSEGRAPRWPAGFVGSITHCDGFCCAVAAAASDAVGVGVDAELATPLEPDLAARICRDEELTAHRALPQAAVDWAKIAFSAKEAFYKCYHPLTRSFLDFHDVAILFRPSVEAQQGAFRVLIRHPGRPGQSLADACHGRWLQASDRVFAGATLMRDALDGSPV